MLAVVVLDQQNHKDSVQFLDFSHPAERQVFPEPAHMFLSLQWWDLGCTLVGFQLILQMQLLLMLQLQNKYCNILYLKFVMG